MLTGAAWALAIGSRITQALPVAALTALLCIEMLGPRHRGGWRALLALILPLGLGLAVLGWYNWARFGSVFETGISYQLSQGFQAHPDQLFSPLYILQNLANYLFALPGLGYSFPYLKPYHGFRASVIAGLPMPGLYWSSWMTGLFFTSPFIILCLPTALRAVRAVRNDQGGDHDRHCLGWITTALWVACLSALAIVGTFFWSAERYMVDFVPALFVLSLMGYWQLGRTLSRPRGSRVLYVLIGLTLFGVTVLASNLLAVALNADGFRALNPILWRQLGNVFRP